MDGAKGQLCEAAKTNIESGRISMTLVDGKFGHGKRRSDGDGQEARSGSGRAAKPEHGKAVYPFWGVRLLAVCYRQRAAVRIHLSVIWWG